MRKFDGCDVLANIDNRQEYCNVIRFITNCSCQPIEVVALRLTRGGSRATLTLQWLRQNANIWFMPPILIRCRPI